MNVLLTTSILGLAVATFAYEIVVAVSDISSSLIVTSAGIF